MRVLLWCGAFVLLAVLAWSCGTQSGCTPDNCMGCCDSKNVCQTGFSVTACGRGGTTCRNCGAGLTCSQTLNTCVGPGGGAGGGAATGGGSATGGGAATGGGSATGGGGAATGGGSATGGGAATGGGSATGGGAATGGGSATGGGGGCTGCLQGGFCYAGTSDSACGTGGATCTDCTSSGQTCNASHSCGTLTGVTGSGCGTVADCTNVGGSLSTGLPQCKLNQMWITASGMSQGSAYPGGYCTRRCISDPDCGAGAECAIGLGLLGEAENICMATCTGAGSQGSCRSGYRCVDVYGDGSQVVCMPPVVVFDAGTPAPTGLEGSPCASNASCMPPNTGFCNMSSAGFPMGSCSADCSMGDNTFCGSDGTCNLERVSANDGLGDLALGRCYQLCNSLADGGSGGSGASCRTGYFCSPYSGTFGGVGFCKPRCDSSGFPGCGADTCDPASGACCGSGVCY